MYPLNKLFYYFSFVLILSFFSCGKDQEVFTPDVSESPDPLTVLNSLTKQPTNYLLHIGADTVFFRSPEGIEIIIPPKSLYHLDGSLVDGAVRMQYLEIENRKAILLNNISSVYNGKIMDIQKAFYLNFKVNNQQIYLNPKAAEIKIFLPTKAPVNQIGIFAGRSNEENLFEWHHKYDDIALVYTSKLINGQSENGYSFAVNQLLWQCLAILPESFNMNNKDLVVCSELTGSVSTAKNAVFVILDKYNSVIRLHSMDEKMVICSNELNLPEGAEVKIIGISVLNEDIKHFGMTNAIIKKDQNITLNLNPSSLSEIDRQLDKL
ncbi:MAG: hypothetical protein IPM42_12695 [Saprospiraceae bacterium]|nr:hypothetical protein [Saprospiraceae bacterium]